MKGDYVVRDFHALQKEAEKSTAGPGRICPKPSAGGGREPGQILAAENLARDRALGLTCRDQTLRLFPLSLKPGVVLPEKVGVADGALGQGVEGTFDLGFHLDQRLLELVNALGPVGVAVVHARDERGEQRLKPVGRKDALLHFVQDDVVKNLHRD